MAKGKTPRRGSGSKTSVRNGAVSPTRRGPDTRRSSGSAGRGAQNVTDTLKPPAKPRPKNDGGSK